MSQCNEIKVNFKSFAEIEAFRVKSGLSQFDICDFVGLGIKSYKNRVRNKIVPTDCEMIRVNNKFNLVVGEYLNGKK